MPYPQNVETAKAVEATVRAAGAVPATIAIIDGRIKVGLCDERARTPRRSAKGVVKASRRDLAAVIVAQGECRHDGRRDDGDRRARRHRGFRDRRHRRRASRRGADLRHLRRPDRACAERPVAVVCAGCKSILDIAKTLEFLETQGVPVVGYGTDEFPAFFARSSGHKLDHRFDSAAEIAARHPHGAKARVAERHPDRQSDSRGGRAAGRGDRGADRRCGEGCRERRHRQKEVTPYLLARINELTGGKSLTANIALIKNNARVAAEIAVALAELPVDA